jgi:hypothetical protein
MQEERAAKESPLTAALNRLEKESEVLLKHCEELGRRLAPLIPDQPEAPTVDRLLDRQRDSLPTSPVVARVMTAGDRVASASRRIGALGEQIEL